MRIDATGVAAFLPLRGYAPAARESGVPPPRDGQGGRFRTASLHSPAAR